MIAGLVSFCAIYLLLLCTTSLVRICRQWLGRGSAMMVPSDRCGGLIRKASSEQINHGSCCGEYGGFQGISGAHPDGVGGRPTKRGILLCVELRRAGNDLALEGSLKELRMETGE